MFLSPIFYPVSAIPDYLKPIYFVNPLGYVVEDVRSILIWGNAPNWTWCVIGTLIGVLVSISGYLWFKKTKGGFADVL
ncbi:ABC-2 type transporter [compost metagenome]